MKKVKIILNGFEESIPEGLSIQDLIQRSGEGDPNLIVEHNGRFVYPNQYDKIILDHGDRIELINPSFGG